mmetsp:Transcript_18611/g.70399  ORF Transcript_18611/g.70399 Transcript_18611/m.70399 type:complete len:255 (-) Transcript_18611:93-857(-)
MPLHPLGGTRLALGVAFCVGELGSVMDDEMIEFSPYVRLFLKHIDCVVDHGQVGQHASLFDSASGGDDRLRLSISDPCGKLARGKAAENDTVNSPEPVARKHSDDRLRNHRHVDHDSVSLLDAKAAQPGCAGFDLLQQLLVRDLATPPSDVALVRNGRLDASAVQDLSIHGVVAHVDFSIGKPLVEGRPRRVQSDLRFSDPRDPLSCIVKPECFLSSQALAHHGAVGGAVCDVCPCHPASRAIEDSHLAEPLAT